MVKMAYAPLSELESVDTMSNTCPNNIIKPTFSQVSCITVAVVQKKKVMYNYKNTVLDDNVCHKSNQLIVVYVYCMGVHLCVYVC